MNDRTLERFAELLHKHVHTTYDMVMSTIQTEPDLIRHTIQEESLPMEESHPLHQISLQIRESLWQAMYKLIQDERNLIERMCDAIEKDNPATAGSMGVIIDCCNEKLDELRCCANTCQIKLN